MRFPSLSEQEFAFLKAHYGRGTSRVKYQRGETYTLTDMLQPPIQALANKTLIMTNRKESSSNCWSTAYEVSAFDPDRYSLYTSNDTQLLEILKDPRNATVVKPGETMQPGDLAVAWATYDGRPTIFHAWIYIDRGLYFEKESVGSSAFQVTRFSNYMQPVSVAPARPVAADRSQVEVFRIDPKTAPKGRTVLRDFSGPGGLDHPEKNPLVITQDYPIVYDRLGRATLTGPYLLDSAKVYESGVSPFVAGMLADPEDQSNLKTFDQLKKSSPGCLVRVIHAAIQIPRSALGIDVPVNSSLIRVRTEGTTFKVEMRLEGFGIRLREEHMALIAKKVGQEDFTYRQGADQLFEATYSVTCTETKS